MAQAHFELRADQAYDRSLNTNVIGFDMILEPAAEETSYAIYELPVSGFSCASIGIDITFDDAQASKLWFGVSDFDKEAWDLRPATPGITSISPPDGTIRSRAGYCYLLIVAYDGLVATITGVSADVTVPTWAHHTIDDSDFPGMVACMQSFDGVLYIAYDAWDAKEIRLARATESTPTDASHWQISTIVTNTWVRKIDLRLINGLPAIGYVDNTSDMFTYARALNMTPAGPSDWVVMPLTTLVNEEQFSLAEVNGVPAFAYVEWDLSSNKRISYAFATVADPIDAIDWDPGVAVPATLPGHHLDWPSLDEAGGRAAFTYHSSVTDNLHYARCTTATPQATDDWQLSIVDDTFSGGRSVLIGWQGAPLVAYYDYSFNVLKLASADDWEPGGPADWTRHEVDATWEAVGGIGLAPVGGRLAMTYRAPNAYEELRCAWTDEELPDSIYDWLIATVDTEVGIGGSNSLAQLPDGRPVIAYVDVLQGMLRFAAMDPWS